MRLIIGGRQLYKITEILTINFQIKNIFRISNKISWIENIQIYNNGISRFQVYSRILTESGRNFLSYFFWLLKNSLSIRLTIKISRLVFPFGETKIKNKIVHVRWK